MKSSTEERRKQREKETSDLPEGTKKVFKVGSHSLKVGLHDGKPDWTDDPYIDVDIEVRDDPNAVDTVTFEPGKTKTDRGDQIPLQVAEECWSAHHDQMLAIGEKNDKENQVLNTPDVEGNSAFSTW